MRYVTATEAKQQFGSVIDAAQREPVTIRRQQRDVAVVLSAEDYARLTRANIDAFQRFCDETSAAAAGRGLSEAKLAELLAEDG